MSLVEFHVFVPHLQVSLSQTSNMKQKKSGISGWSEDVEQMHSVTRNSLEADNGSPDQMQVPLSVNESTQATLLNDSTVAESRDDSGASSSSGSPWYQLRSDATSFVSQTLLRGRKNLWQLTTSRVSVLLSSSSVGSTSIHQFLRNYEDLSVFILAGEAFCGVEAVEFRQKLKVVCENYVAAFHRQNIYVSLLHSPFLSVSSLNILSFPLDKL